MNLLEVIRNHFLILSNIGNRPIQGVPDAWSFKTLGSYGVFILNPNDIKIMEKFMSIDVYNDLEFVDGQEVNVLKMGCTDESMRNEFAGICNLFIEMGIDSENRTLLQNEPVKWTTKYEQMLGNTIRKKMVHDVLAELLVLEYFEFNKIPNSWRGPDSSTKDFDLFEYYVDVKSTKMRIDSKISISSQYQLQSDKPMKIYFCRLETMESGETINKVAARLENLGYNGLKLENKLSALGFPANSKERDIGFDILEKKVYAVDEGFPAITPHSFKNDRLPDNVLSISYTIDLSNINFENW